MFEKFYEKFESIDSPEIGYCIEFCRSNSDFIKRNIEQKL